MVYPAGKSMQAGGVERLQREAVRAAALLRGLANPQRLALLCQMLEAERCVSELEEATGIRQPTLSQQLGVLRRQGFVKTRREGKRIHYRVGSPAAATVLEVLYSIYCAPKAGNTRKGNPGA